MRFYFFVFDVFYTIYIGIHPTVQAVLSVDFSISGIWGKLGTGAQSICLKSRAKFPPKRNMCSRDAIVLGTFSNFAAERLLSTN